ncbi:hypothetical protein Isop_2774 [Isosphaera pallida ATCC 43644]|uniref:Lipoprotein n=2 Tax=Isosphaera pallida TaxID=128 RepID=E8R0K8_ISOPI|nr:hypothetical protein Isop_2774 [Isosphaera pallida ATCC 43644]
MIPKVSTMTIAWAGLMLCLGSFLGCGGTAGDIQVYDVTKEKLPPPPEPPKPGAPGTAPPKGGGSPSQLPDFYTK